jgi:hypothetical protein
MPLLEIISRGQHPFSPDLGVPTERWWYDPQQPTELMAPGLIENCIEQINEPPGGKQSCFLTSQLNAWILRGELTPDEALYVQEEALTSSALRRYWFDQSQFGRDYVAWSPRHTDTSYVVRELIGRNMPHRAGPASDLTKELDAGYAVVATSVEHSRVAYKVGPLRMAVYDAKFPQVRGVFGPEKLPKLQHPDQQIVVI